jgi:hypothetical protein
VRFHAFTKDGASRRWFQGVFMGATKRLRRDDNHFIAADRMKHAHAIAIGQERFFVLAKHNFIMHLSHPRAPRGNQIRLLIAANTLG